MNLNQIQLSGRTDKVRSDVEQFRAFRAFTCPRGYKVMPSNHRSVANINTSNSVCIPSVSTPKASKYQRVSVSLIHMPATRTTPTGILRRNQFKSNPLGLGFVLHEELSHGIRPAMDSASHFFSLGNTGFSDISQILHDNSLSPVFDRPRHKPLRGTVQKMFGYGCFVPAQTLQESARGTSANRLDLGFGFSDATTTGIEFPAMESESLGIIRIGCSKDAFNSTVNPNDTASGFWFGNINIVAQQQIPNRTNSFKFRISPNFFRWNAMVIQNNRFAPETDAFGFGVRKVSSPNHRNDFTSKLAFLPTILRLIGFVGRSYMAKNRANNLRWKIKLLTKRLVMLFVKSNAICNLGLKNKFGSPIASCEKLFKQLIEFFGFANFDFDCSSTFHHISLYYKSFENPSFCENSITSNQGHGRHLLPDPKEVGVSCLLVI